ncbi:hypothetical protein A2U01_0011616 [Trifolium medium]|uniref:Uncharacterized protein n=1 Tax=Trifolium medium TaxID=97028 RepID=A0A392MWP0_9FABA|nr:hypothetical protein [Trifolium medium]
MTNYNSLKHAHGGIVIRDSVTPQHEKKVIDLETDNEGSKVVEDDSFEEDTVDLATRLD